MAHERASAVEAGTPRAAQALLALLGLLAALAGCDDSGGFDTGDGGTGTDTDTDADADSDGDSDADGGGDCADEWYDSGSGLSWAVLPSTEGEMTWQAAVDFCDGLSLCGHEWRLPTIGELRSLVRGCAGTETGGACGVTDTCVSSSDCLNPECDSCEYNAGPDEGCYRPADVEGSCIEYWSSTADGDEEAEAWEVGFRTGAVVAGVKSSPDAGARCVHSGE